MAKTSPINMRVEPAQHALLTRAAKLKHMDRTTFVLDAACREAENVLLDQRLFVLNDLQFAEFQALLDAPVGDTPKLRELLATPAPWE